VWDVRALHGQLMALLSDSKWLQDRAKADSVVLRKAKTAAATATLLASSPTTTGAVGGGKGGKKVFLHFQLFHYYGPINFINLKCFKKLL
jgi:hypothetical protein